MNICFLGGSNKMTDGTEKPQIPSNKILYFWLRLTIFQLDLHNVMIPYLYPLVRNVFWTGSEYKIMRNFIV